MGKSNNINASSMDNTIDPMDNEWVTSFGITTFCRSSDFKRITFTVDDTDIN
jgi:hypothetical protein